MTTIPNKIRAIYGLLRIPEQTFILFVILMGNFIYSLSFNMITIIFLVYSVFLLSFTFVVNDISDVKVDRLNKKTRNPIARGEIGRIEADLMAILLLILVTLTAFYFPPNIIPYAVVLIFISLTYSIFVKAKSTPIIDLIYHGIAPTIVFLMLTVIYSELSLVTFFVAMIIYGVSLLIQLLQEIRDITTDRKLIKTTVIILGKRNSIKLCIAILASLVFIVLIAIVTSVFPIKSIAYLPLSYFLFEPLFKPLKRESYAKSLLDDVRKKLVYVTIAFFVLFLFLSVV